MATLQYFPSFHSLSSCRIAFSSSNFCIYHRRECCLRVSASSSKKSRFSKNTTKESINVNLCNEIREFLSTIGFPEDHVPSVKEFSQLGRQDLANIVRRRGYAFIRQLLQTPTTTSFIDSNTGAESTRNFEAPSVSECQDEKLETKTDNALSIDIHGNSYKHQETDDELYLNDQSTSASDLTSISLQDKVARFIKYGELDEIDDQDPLITIYANEGEKDIGLEDAHEPEFTSEPQDNRDPFLFKSSGAEILNGNAPSPVPISEYPVQGNENSRNNDASYGETPRMTHDIDLDVEKPKAEDLAEVERLKSILHQKALELDHLKQQIEKEKVALFVLQKKAEKEICKAQECISEKEAELRTAGGSLSGLKEVEVQYSGDGEAVELAGSFNGWHSNIGMDPQPLPSSVDSTVSRKSKHWKTVLWLYPGVYEIKFVVDGHWKIDPSKESIFRDSLHNNILRVDR